MLLLQDLGEGRATLEGVHIWEVEVLIWFEMASVGNARTHISL